MLSRMLSGALIWAAVMAAVAAAGDAADDQRCAEPGGFAAVVFPRWSINVSPRFDGILEDIRAETGDRVQEGEVLARLDTVAIEQELEIVRREREEEQAQLSSAIALRKIASEELKHIRDISDQGAGSPFELAVAEYRADAARAEVKAREAAIARREARVRLLEDRIAKARITAPFSGVVAGCFQEPGATIARGTPIVRLISEEDLWVRFAVPQERAGEINPGVPVFVRLAGLGERVRGVVRRVTPEVDPVLGIVLAEARLPADGESGGRLRPGMPARVFLGAEPAGQGPPVDPPSAAPPPAPVGSERSP